MMLGPVGTLTQAASGNTIIRGNNLSIFFNMSFAIVQVGGRLAANRPGNF
jgi:hypothetical protein